MNKKTLAALVLAPAFMLSACEKTPAESPELTKDVTTAISATFNAHALQSPLPQGYTIPWVSHDSMVSGHAVARGELGEKGCDVYDVDAIYNSDIDRRTDSVMEICPKP